ncbi:MAG TPA: hypothetical protein VKF35_20360 [Hyphomicrobiaceae bacterium]|nr:hypothetical protein [Hyphomicrobiaceae bacterium]
MTLSANNLRIGQVRRFASSGRLIVAMLIASLVAFAAERPAFAQNARPITMKVPPQVIADPAAQVAFPIHIEPLDAVPRNSFVRLRGLPPMAALSEGYVIGPGSWAVPISALPDLKISLPGTATGRSEVTILLVGIDGAVLVESKTALSVAAGQAPQARERAAAPAVGATMLRAGVPVDLGAPARSEPATAARPEPPVQPVVPRSMPQDRERAMRLLTKGNEQLDEGNVSAARLFYERAADAGLAEGAMALAATFDATELGRLNVRGIKADSKQARQWYERARQLGAGDAEERLRRLGAN